MTTATAPTPTAAPPADGTPPPIPDAADHPRVRAAQANVSRLAGEVNRLERELAAQQQLHEEILVGERQVARRLVDGATLVQVRTRPLDGVVSRLHTDVRHARQGLNLAKAELAQVEREVALELAVQYAPTFFARIRPAVEAYVAFQREMVEYQAAVDEVRAAGLLVAPCTNVLAGLADEDPLRFDGRLSYVLRELIDAGVLHERRDAGLLAGLSIQPKYVPEPPPPPPVPRKQDGAIRRMFRYAGVPGFAGD